MGNCFLSLGNQGQIVLDGTCGLRKLKLELLLRGKGIKTFLVKEPLNTPTEPFLKTKPGGIHKTFYLVHHITLSIPLLKFGYKHLYGHFQIFSYVHYLPYKIAFYINMEPTYNVFRLTHGCYGLMFGYLGGFVVHTPIRNPGYFSIFLWLGTFFSL